VKWAEDTVDNENLNKRKSKICCIYEKPRSHPGTSSSSCSSGSDCGNNYDKFPKHQRRAMREHKHAHDCKDKMNEVIKEWLINILNRYNHQTNKIHFFEFFHSLGTSFSDVAFPTLEKVPRASTREQGNEDFCGLWARCCSIKPQTQKGISGWKSLQAIQQLLCVVVSVECWTF
jgi:Protein phosphatase inhibitor